MFTARAATNRVVIAETAASASIIIFTRLVSGITSVGLNATAFLGSDHAHPPCSSHAFATPTTISQA
jgi:hypothetical protein